MKRTTAVCLILFILFLAPAPYEAAAMQADPETIEDGELTPVAGRPCVAESTLRSLNSDTRTFLRFRNASTQDVTYYWINFEGKRELKRTLKPGEGYSLWTYLTHPFIVVNANGSCITVYMPQKEYGLVVIKEG